MDRTQKSSHGNRIRGSLDPFKNSELELTYLSIKGCKDGAPANLLDMLREMMKDSTAILFFDALKSNQQYNLIPEASMNIIFDELSERTNPFVASFAECTLKYFNNERQHILTLNLTESYYRPREVEKAVVQASATIKKAYNFYIKKILSMLKNENIWKDLPEREKVIQKYEAIGVALNFLCDFFVQLFKGKLPRSLGTHIFQKAVRFDPKLDAAYTLIPEGLYVQNKKDNFVLSSFSFDCTVCLITCTQNWEKNLKI